jgi:hypothetical protein
MLMGFVAASFTSSEMSAEATGMLQKLMNSIVTDIYHRLI